MDSEQEQGPPRGPEDVPAGPSGPHGGGDVQYGSEPSPAAGGEANVQGPPEKDPGEWVTGDEPMTGAQASYLQTLTREAGEEFDPGLTKAEASRKIDELQEKTGRGSSA